MSLSETIRVSSVFKNIHLHEYSERGIDSPSVIKKKGSRSEQNTIQTLPIVDEKAIHEAYQQGIEEGNRRATELLHSEYVHRIELEQQKINDVIQRIENSLKELSPKIENVLLHFSLGVAEQIVRQEIATNPQIVLNVIKDGIRNILGVEKIKIRINPVDKNIIQESKISIQSISESLREIIFETDENVEAGGCIIESDIGNVDARIATQIEQVNKIITEYHQ